MASKVNNMKKGRTLGVPLIAIAVALLSGTLTLAQPTTAMKGLTPTQLQDGSAKFVGHLQPEQSIRLNFGLEHPHLAEEEQFLKELGTKGSPNFQHFLTADEWNKRFSPSAEDEQAVVDWATSQGFTVTQRFANRLLVDVEAPSATIEKALGVTINSYQVGARTAFSNDHDPVLPAAVAHLIHSVGGLNNIQVLHPHSKLPEPAFESYVSGPAHATGPASQGSGSGKRPTTANQAGPTPNISNGAYDPSDLYSSQAYDFNALYSLGHCCNPTGNAGSSPVSSSIAIATAGSQTVSDMTSFYSHYGLAWNLVWYYIDGTPTCCDGEGTMDAEWSGAMSNSFGSYVDTAKIYLYDGVNANFSTFTDVYNHILSDGHARVFSTSWGCEEISCTPTSVMDTDHGIFNSMVGQGWTLVAAAGDQGATAGCGKAVAVQYPASDPNIVGAGGTTLSLYSNSTFYSETAWSGGPDGCGANDGGGTGGFSAYYGAPSYQSNLGFGSRAVPDIALNADWYNTPQNLYFGGAFQPNGGTSIVAPEVAGFFAQANAYMDFVATQNGGCYGGTTCSPIGNGNWYLYYFGENPNYAPHYPFYDILYGCNNNNITSYYGLGYYCAAAGYDEVTGWGSFNALQLSWAINAYRAGDFGAPTAAIYTSATAGVWYNTDQWVEWFLSDTSGDGLPLVGIAGFTQSWDTYPRDSVSLSRPPVSDGFFTGPQSPNETYGYEYVSGAGQGCHTAYVRTYDNSGSTAVHSFGPVCYDTVPPVSTATLSGTISSGVYISKVTITLSATDANSGVAHIYYSVDGAGYAAYTAPIAVSTAGTHTLLYYAKDVAGNSETAHTSVFSIKSPTTTTVTSGLNPSTYGQAVVLTAKVTPTFGAVATGTVTFKDGATTLAAVALSSGQATLSTSALQAGTHSITAVYGGSTIDVASTSAVLTETVAKATSTTVVTSSLNPSIYGEAVIFTATITSSHGGSVSGTVTFKDGATTLGTGAVNTTTNKATFTTSVLAEGSHSITADYGGSVNDAASNSAALAQTVNKTTSTTVVTSSLNPSIYGEAVTITATITSAHGGSVSGTVTFKDGATTLGTGAVNTTTNKATFTTSTLAAGSHSITADYGGSVDDGASNSAALAQTVNKATSTSVATSSLNASIYGEAVTITATITPAHGGSVSGTVTFKDGATTLGTGAVNTTTNKATFTTSALAVGSHSITADYGGSVDDAASNSAALAQTVNKATTTSTLVSSVNPDTQGTAITFTATVTAAHGGTVSGTVTFKDGATTIGTGVVNSATDKATFTTSALAAGTHSITALYGGNADLDTSTSSALSQVEK